jgi:MFS family permease
MSSMAARAAMSSIAGSALEWLDFAAYSALAATVLPQLFFNNADPALASMLALATLSVGFVARPAGGLVCGYLGDRLGRKATLIFTFLLMGIASFLIGILPTYASIGAWAPAALVSLRFLQGFALGGEVTGSQLMTMEHAPPQRRGFYGSLVAMGSPLAQVLANGMLFVIAASMTSGQFNRYGWRLPFLMSVLLVGVGLYVRIRVTETPLFDAARKIRQSAPGGNSSVSSKLHVPTVLRLLAVWTAVAVGFFMASVFAISFMTRTLGVPKQSAFAILIVAHLASMVAIGLGGSLCDRIGRKTTMLIASRILLVAMLGFFPLIMTAQPLLMGLAVVLLLCAVQMHAGVQPAWFAEQFPTEVRYIGSALVYTLPNIVGSAAPFAATWLQAHANGANWLIVATAVLLCLISMAAVYASPETLARSAT